MIKKIINLFSQLWQNDVFMILLVIAFFCTLMFFKMQSFYGELLHGTKMQVNPLDLMQQRDFHAH